MADSENGVRTLAKRKVWRVFRYRLVSVFVAKKNDVCTVLERKDKNWFKRDIIVLISFLVLFVSISFLVNIGREMSLPGFHNSNPVLVSNFVFASTCYFMYMYNGQKRWMVRNYATRFLGLCSM